MAQALGDGPLAAADGGARPTTCARCGPTWTGAAASGCAASSDLGYGEATGALEEIGELDDLLDQLGQEHPGATLDDVDVEAVERQLGRRAADDVRRLRELERELRRQGWVTRDDDGLTLTPEGAAAAGRHRAAARSSPSSTAGRRGQHDLRDAGAAGELTGASRALGVRRRAAARRGPDGRQRGAPRPRPGSATLPVRAGGRGLRGRRDRAAGLGRGRALRRPVVLDVAEGRWGPMKQTALALSHLVATRFPQDALQIIGFGRYAMTAVAGGAGRGRAGHGARAPTCSTRCSWPAGTCAGTRTPSRSCWS